MSDSQEPIVDFERLNLLGRAVFLGGSAVRLAAGAIDAVVKRAADIYTESERAFLQGRDPNVEDAKIIDEDT